MKHRFGPWSSALGEGPSPHLSTFWKRRLALLGDARAAQHGPTRRDLLKLAIGGAAAFALPTLHLASADGPAATKPLGAGKLYVLATFQAGGDVMEGGIFAIDPETAARARVSDFVGQIRLSPDGRTLALSRAGWSGSSFREVDDPGIWTLDAAGKGKKRRVAGIGGAVAWSPDGKQFIVTKGSSPRENDRREVWRFDADGSNSLRLPIPETDGVDDWSPDGQWLVTVSDRHPPRGSGYQLYLMRPDGTDQRRLTVGPGLNVYPKFSPDGKQVAYLHQEKGKNSIRIDDLDGGNRRTVIEDEGDTSPHDFCWSPDGKSLACVLEDWQRDEQGKRFISDPEKSKPRIIIADVDGKDRRPLDLPGALWIGYPGWR